MLARLLPGDVLCYVDTQTRAFALTFDDGPHPHTTPGLLDVLARHGAKATFFLIGERVHGNERLVARIAAEGHELANHLMHDEASIRLPGPRFERELAQVTTMLAVYGAVRWARPGSGWFTPRMLRAASRQELRLVLGTLVAMHTGGPGDARIAGRIAAATRSGSIVVLHEGTVARRGVVDSTNQLLTELDRRGLAAVTVSHLHACRSE